MPKVRKKTKRSAEPAIIYPTIKVNVCTGDNALTVDNARALLGWQSETDKVKFHDAYLFSDTNKLKVRCTNNTKNRPLDEGWAKTIAQEILNRRWRLNLETIIVGKYGEVLSGQHRLIGLVLAGQLWETDKHWRDNWPNEPTIDVLVAFGADESEECKRTLDNVKPRTLMDVLFTSNVFAGHRPKDRKALSRIMDYAVRLLWQRTGAVNDPYAPRRTHSEALEFIDNHPKLLECVKLIHVEDVQGMIRKCIGLGYAAGLMYLMAASADDPNTYRDNKPFSESNLELALWDDAVRFWESFSQPQFKVVRKTIASLSTDEEGEDVPVLVYERLACIINAWNCLTNGDDLDEANIMPEYGEDGEDEDGFRYLVSNPSLGGIDQGIDDAED